MYTNAISLILAATVAQAASAQYEIVWDSIDAGGGTSAGGAYETRDSLGQYDAGQARTSVVSVYGGFRAYASAFCMPDITTQGAAAGSPNFGVPDGDVTAADVNYFVNSYVAADLAIADITTQGAGISDPGYGVPDGAVTAADLQFYVNFWVAGCP